MPTYDKLALGKRARELGFVRDAFEKMSRLTDVLRFINAERELNPLLALKGGTAINLTVFNLPRLSVDIDLDFAENLTKEETATKRTRINELLGRYMAAEGYTFKEKSKHTHALDSLVYSYINAAGNPDNIKVEINYGLRSHALPTIESTAKTDGAFSDFTIRTLTPVEIFASKIVALTGRGAVRDLYDLNNMVDIRLFCDTDLTLLRKCAVFYFVVAGDAQVQGFDLKKLNSITARTVRTDLVPMIRNADKFDFVSAKTHVSEFLSELLTLNDRESAFLHRFVSGHYEPELLFEDSKILERVENHPMALWRIQHIEKPASEAPELNALIAERGRLSAGFGETAELPIGAGLADKQPVMTEAEAQAVIRREAARIAREHFGKGTFITNAEPGKEYRGEVLAVLGTGGVFGAVMALPGIDIYAVLHDLKKADADSLEAGRKAVLATNSEGVSVVQPEQKRGEHGQRRGR